RLFTVARPAPPNPNAIFHHVSRDRAYGVLAQVLCQDLRSERIEQTMSEWEFAQSQPSDELAKLHFFSMKKRQPEGDIEFTIRVREYVDRNPQKMRFFAEADKKTNKQTA